MNDTSQYHIMNSLHFTPMQCALSHVKSTWRSSQIGASTCEQDSGVRKSMVNEVQALVKLFVEKMGTDLATLTEKNHLWHTGNPRKMRDDTNIKQCQPWEYVNQVAMARSIGEGCSQAEWWHVKVRHLVEECMFCM